MVGPGKDSKVTGWIGASTELRDGKTFFKTVLAGSAASDAGISPGDELVALDSWRLGHQDFVKRLKERDAVSPVRLMPAREGFLREQFLALPSGAPPEPRIEKSENAASPQFKCRERWLGSF
jgi:predicted metalloprotease with PDZ domain